MCAGDKKKYEVIITDEVNYVIMSIKHIIKTLYQKYAEKAEYQLCQAYKMQQKVSVQ